MPNWLFGGGWVRRKFFKAYAGFKSMASRHFEARNAKRDNATWAERRRISDNQPPNYAPWHAGTRTAADIKEAPRAAESNIDWNIWNTGCHDILREAMRWKSGKEAASEAIMCRGKSICEGVLKQAWSSGLRWTGPKLSGFIGIHPIIQVISAKSFALQSMTAIPKITKFQIRKAWMTLG